MNALAVIGYVFAIGFMVIIGNDIYLAARYGWNSTLSFWILTNSYKYPIIPWVIGLAMGLLAGHLFWNQLLNVTVCPGVTSQ